MRPDPPTIVFAVNDGFVLPLLVAWNSLAQSNPELIPEADIVVLHEEGLTAAGRGRLARHAARLGLRLTLCPVRLPDLPYGTRFGGTRAHYLRLAIPRALAGRGRVLYLDADVLVLDGIRALIDADLQGMPFGAVQDPINPTFGTGKALPGWRRLGIAAQRAYFNSGVLLLDLPAVDRDGVVDRALRMVARHPELLRLWDQDALNAAADDRWCRLPRRWNAAPISALRRTPWVRLEEGHAVPVAELEAAESAAAVLHFLSPAKPWLDKFPDGAVNDLYRRHLAAVSAADGLDQRPTGAVT